MGDNWESLGIQNGVGTFKLNSWNDYPNFIDTEMLDFREYIYRGHQNEDWKLEPTFNRRVSVSTKAKLTRLRKLHLQNFRYALRGRIPDSNKYTDEDELWALGQHHGLATPLLDWTNSPYVAAYFSYFESNEHDTDYRVVYALDRDSIQEINDLKIVNPITDDNKRLINQSGLFIKQLTYKDIESLISAKFKGNNENFYLIKIKIPNENRETALRSLNRMNINHNTLFPDIEGASIFCNTDLDIENY